jgi:hypothetical protein
MWTGSLHGLDFVESIGVIWDKYGKEPGKNGNEFHQFRTDFVFQL